MGHPESACLVKKALRTPDSSTAQWPTQNTQEDREAKG